MSTILRLWLCAALAIAGGASAQNKPVSGLGARGPIADADQIPDLPSGGAHLQAAYASDLKAYTLGSVDAFGADPTGVSDSTTAIQTAINSGRGFSCAGVYKTSSTLNFTTLSTGGEDVRGSAATAAGGPTSNRCTIRPTSAVSTAVLIDGTGFSGYVTSLRISGLTIDMANMSGGSYAFRQGQSYDIHYQDVRAINYAAGDILLQLGPGAFTTQADSIAGPTVYCLGNGSNNPTTLTLVNSDVLQLNAEQCANVTTVGGAVQFSYSPGVTTISYIAPGATNLLGFYPTTAALWAATGGTPAGMYVALGSYTLNAQTITSLGTDWEQLTPLPAACSIAGSSWAFGTYNDGVHGCLPIVWSLSIGGNTRGCEYDNPTFAGLYLWTPNSAGCTIRGFASGSANQNITQLPIQSIWTGPLQMWNAQALRLYSDLGSTVTAILDGSTGAMVLNGGATVGSLVVNGLSTLQNINEQAAANGSNFISVVDANAHPMAVAFSGGTRAADSWGFGSINIYSDDGGTNNTISLNQNGTMFIDPATDGTAFLVKNHAGTNEFYVTTNAAPGSAQVITTGSMAAASFIAGSSAGVTCSGAPTGSFAATAGIVTHC